jgi:histidinol dehydrogenase
MRVLEGKAAVRYAATNLLYRGSTLSPKVERTSRRIVEDVRRNGEDALRKYAEKFDGLRKDEPILVSQDEMQAALREVSNDFIRAIKTAAKNIRRFAEWQKPKAWMKKMRPGISVGQKVEPIMSVGCYVPGGRYPLPSSLLMTVIPAQVAGVPAIAVASPYPAKETLAAAATLNVEYFYRIGGAQAIAAFAYGTKSVWAAQKIVGPGNAYVTAAKKLVAFDCAIDMLAGPTEALVLAHAGDPEFYAADLVAQAEHDPDSLVIFISSKLELAREVVAAADRQAKGNTIAQQSIARNAVALVIPNQEAALGCASAIAPEHITLPKRESKYIGSAGSVFVGQYSPQSLGDYAAGPNHTLPTGGAARYRGGLSVLDFVKIITVQEVTKAGLKKIAPVVTTLAEAEGLKSHAESVRVRLR